MSCRGPKRPPRGGPPSLWPLRRAAADTLGEAVLEACWLAALAVVPMYFNLYSERGFDADKVALLKVLAVVAGAAWVAKVALGGRVWARGCGDGDAPAAAVPGWSHLLMVLVPVAGVLASFAVSTLLSMSPGRSWEGSYFRQQGVMALLAYVALAFAALAFLRSQAQWRRARLAIVLGSIPVGVYAFAQRFGLDPLAGGPERVRVASALGNPVFLGGYLALVLFVTADALADPPADIGTARRRRTYQAAFAALLALQLGALLLSQSRGPVLGVLAGLAVAALARTLSWRSSVVGVKGRPWRRWGWALVLGAVVAASGALVATAVPGSPLAWVRELPTVGRLATALDPSSRSSQVRLMTWRGVVELTASAPPLRWPDGNDDPRRTARFWVGYGPDCFDLAYNRVYSERLGVLERRTSVPDRAHSEVFDVLIGNGAAGVAAWLIFLAAVLAMGAASAAGRGGDAAVTGRVLLAGLAGAASATGASFLVGRPEYVGLLIPAGLVAGTCAALLWLGLRRPPGTASRPAPPLLAAGLLGCLTCHLTEVSVGIPMTVSRFTFLFLVAVTAAAWVGRGEVPWRDASAPANPSRAGGLGEAGIAALLAGGGLATAAFALLLSRPLQAGAERSEALWETFGVSARGAWGVGFVLLLSAAFAAVAVSHLGPGPGRRRALVAWLVLLGVGPAIAVGGMKILRMAQTARVQQAGASPESVMEQVSGHPLWYFAAVLLLVAVLAMLIARRQVTGDLEHALNATPAAWAWAGVAVLVIVPGVAAARAVLVSIQADILVKQANRVVEQGNAPPALALFRRAHALAPEMTAPLTGIGRAGLRAVRAAAPAGGSLIAEGEEALQQAIRLQPLDPDHHVNLGRLLAGTADLAGDAAARRAWLDRAAEAYRRGIALRPGSVVFRTEFASALVRAGQAEAAVEELEAVAAVDPGWDQAAVLLARIQHLRAVGWLQRGRVDQAQDFLARAVQALSRLLAHQQAGEGGAPGGAAALSQASASELDTPPEAPGSRSPQPADLRGLSALLHLARGEGDRALAEAELAARTGSGAERARAAATLELVRRYLAGTPPAPS